MVSFKTTYATTVLKTTDSDPVFVDFEAFQHGGEDFKLKEICILDSAVPFQPIHMIFTPMTPWKSLTEEQKRTYAFQTRHVHHLEYEEGEREYCQQCVWRRLSSTIPNLSQRVFLVFGLQKYTFLKKEFPQLRWMQYTSLDAVKNLPHLPINVLCGYSRHGEHCAVLKCYRLFHHLSIQCRAEVKMETQQEEEMDNKKKEAMTQSSNFNTYV